MKYRKRPIIVDAFEMTSEALHDPSSWPDWLQELWDPTGELDHHISPDPDGVHLRIRKEPDGYHYFAAGDRVIRSGDDEWSVRSDIFERTYGWVKKPVLVDAWQVTADSLLHEVQWPVWLLGKATPAGNATPEDNPTYLVIHTLEGDRHAVPGAWILKGVAGEVWPVQREVFEHNYEEVAGT